VGGKTVIRKYYYWRAPSVANLNGVDLVLTDPVINEAMQAEIARGQYEQEEVKLADTYIKRDMDIVELGAGIGFVSCYIDTTTDADHSHIAVEANKDLLSLVEDHRNYNRCEFELVHAAYSTQEGSVYLSVDGSFWNGSLYRKGDTLGPIGTTTIRQLVDRFDLSDIALIVDIEGAEADLLQNEMDVLEEHCQLLIIEFHDWKEGYEEVKDDIKTAKDQLRLSNFEEIGRERNVRVFMKSE
jgi:FkbM family methyltransferase